MYQPGRFGLQLDVTVNSATELLFLRVLALDAKSNESVLIQSCLNQKPFAWQKFVDRFLPTVLKTIHEVDTQSSQGWGEARHHDLAVTIFSRLKQDECKLLGEWDSTNDIETWLIVVTRRIALGLKTPEASNPESAKQ